jgi:hypothetical protein
MTRLLYVFSTEKAAAVVEGVTAVTSISSITQAVVPSKSQIKTV